MKKLFTLLFTIGFIFVSCDIFTDNANESEITSELSGYAMFNNSENHSSINIEVKSNGSVVKSTSTDSSGLYFVDGLVEGNYTVTASSVNSKEKSVNTSVLIETRNTTASDLELTAIGHISGRITIDDSASGNLGVLVFVAGTSYVAMTNDFGDFVISDVPVGNNYSVVISKDGYMVIWDTVNVTTGNTTSLNNYNLFSSDFIGNSGDSAYDIWLSLGNEGTEQDFIDSLQGADGIDGTNGTDGINGVDGLSIIWKGSLETHPGNPEVNWAYYNSVDGVSYIYDGFEWSIFAMNGNDGVDGDNGLSIVWKGSLEAHPENPELNWAYYNSIEGISYIFDATDWVILAQDGEDCSCAEEIPRNGLVAEYLFNGNANDTSGNNYHGTVVGATLTTDKDNNSNSAYSFDGVDDYITINDLLNIGATAESYTVNAWIKIDEYPSSGNVYYILGDYWGSYDQTFSSNLTISENTNMITFAKRLNGNVYSVSNDIETTLSEWIFVSVVSNISGQLDLYLNGTIVDSQEYDISNTYIENPIWRIGQNNFSNSNYKGTVDNIRIYDRALSNNEINSLYNESLDKSTYEFIEINTPNGGDNWVKGTSQTITWDDNISENVMIQLWRGDVLETNISTSTESDGEFIWNMTTGYPVSSEYKIKILSVDDSSVIDTSNNSFTISDPITIPRDGLVAEYLFNGDANDTSGYNNHGTVNGASPTTDRDGNANSAYSFNGLDNYIGITNSDSLNIANNSIWTISFWLKSSLSSYGCIINNYDETSKGWGIGIRDTGIVNGRLESGPNTNPRTASHNITTIDTSVNDDSWNNVVIKFDSTSTTALEGITFFVNGNEVDNQIFSSDGYNSNLDYNTLNNLQIGRAFTTSPWGYYSGSIDDLRLYNRELSLEEIFLLFEE